MSISQTPHWLESRIIDPLDRLSWLTARLLSWLVLLMAIMTCVLVVVRYLAELNSVALQELVLYCHAGVFLLVCAYTLRSDDHVRVDIFYRQFSPVTKAWVNALGVILCVFPLSGFLFFISADFVLGAWHTLESSSEPGGLPTVYLLKSLIPLAAIFLVLQGIAELLRNGLVLAGVQDRLSDA